MALYKVKYLAIDDKKKRLEKEYYVIEKNSIKACEKVKKLQEGNYISIGIISVASMTTSDLFDNNMPM